METGKRALKKGRCRYHVGLKQVQQVEKESKNQDRGRKRDK
jgi:hypothetical protein